MVTLNIIVFINDEPSVLVGYCEVLFLFSSQSLY